MASAIRWDVERILKSSMWIIFLILFLFSEFTTKTNRRLIWLSKQRKLLFYMFRLSQHYLKGSRHSNMLIREGEWYFNSIHRREALFCLENSSCHSQIEGIFTMIVRDQRKYWVLSFGKQEIVPNLRGSTQSLSEQLHFYLLFSTPKKTDLFTLYNLILCLSTQEIIHNLGGSIWSLGSFTQPRFTFNFINFLFFS